MTLILEAATDAAALAVAVVVFFSIIALFAYCLSRILDKFMDKTR